MGSEQYGREMREILLPRKRFRQQAEEEKQAGIQGQWQLESPAKEYLEQVKCRDDTYCTENDEAGLHRPEKAFDRIKEAFEQVAQDDEAEKLSIVQEIMIRSTDYLRRIIAPVGGQGGVTMSHLCPNCNSFPLEDYIWEIRAQQLVVERI